MPPASAQRIRDLNTRYHDVAAAAYDSKWSIGYDRDSQAMVADKLRKALGHPLEHCGRALEVGAGTGYFSLNLAAAGTVEQVVATDISPGMLDRLAASAERLGVAVETRCTEAAELPFPDASFDLVLGHAVLHHLPDLDGAFAEFARVLRPGGTLVFCGEPSRHGDRLAALPKRAAVRAAPAWRFLMRASSKRYDSDGDGPAVPAGAPNGAAATPTGEANGASLDPSLAELGEQDLEWLVDVHSFTPGDFVRLARAAGLEHVRVRGEELVSSWFGWVSRTLEGSAEPSEVPAAWRWYAYGGYLALRALDRRLLEPRLPPAIFYNLLLSARKPTL